MPSKRSIRHLLASVSSKRARIVIEHIIEHGFITTEELRQLGYDHPPRAARDVREAGIPLETFRVKSSEGRSIAAYRFGDLSQARVGQLRGRKTPPKRLKTELYEMSGGKCAICSGKFEFRYMQIDHKVPYEVAGDAPSGWNADDYALLCGSCNRAKSWSCEHCPNWLNEKRPSICLTCYWADPENHSHISLREIRRTDIQWDENEAPIYERLRQLARESGSSIPEYIKIIISKHVGGISRQHQEGKSP